MPDRGKFVVAAILAVALGLAVFAWYWRWQQGHKAAEFWGAEASELIRAARQTELLVLEPQDEPKSESGEVETVMTTVGSDIAVEGKRYRVTATVELNNSPGLIHARHSLTEDASFVWHPPTDDCESEWTHAMRLSQNDNAAVLVFDFRCRRIHVVEQNKSIFVVPRIADGFQRIFERAIASQDPAAKD